MFLLPRSAAWLSIFNKQLLTSAANTVIGNTGCSFHYVSYFVLGHYLNRAELSKKMRYTIYFLGGISFFAAIPLSSWLTLRQQSPSQFFFGPPALNIFLESAAIFLFAKRHWIFSDISARALKILRTLSKYSFGAYLVHALFVDHFSSLFGFDTLSFSPILSVPVIGCIVFIISFAISAVINHIPVLNKYIV